MRHKQSGTAFADFGDATFYRYAYNSRGELTLAAGYLGSNVASYSSTNALPGRYFQLGYDQAGNRTSYNATGVAEVAAAYTSNSLNQIQTRENPYVPVSGTVDSSAKVVVSGSLAGQQGAYWSGEGMLDNSAGPAYGAIDVKAAKPSPQTAQTTTVTAFLAPLTETFAYDDDGNLTSDGRWDYTYDAENRLVKMETNSVAAATGLPAKRLVFRYDSEDRRTAKEVWVYVGGSWSKTSEVRFVYQGWNLVAELDASGNRQRTYAWGLDIAGPLSATGGVGALVQMVDHTASNASYLPGYDGSGNVAAMIKSDGTVSAAYEYSPFGETLRHDGAYAATNPFRFSTKYTDDESGLVYYGHRYYSPSLGRFINRDPSGVAGGMNLYAFVANNPVNRIDFLGLLDRNAAPLYSIGNVWFWGETDGHTFEDDWNAFVATSNRIATPAPYASPYDSGLQLRAEATYWKFLQQPKAVQDAIIQQLNSGGGAPSSGTGAPVGSIAPDPGLSQGVYYVNADRNGDRYGAIYYGNDGSVGPFTESDASDLPPASTWAPNSAQVQTLQSTIAKQQQQIATLLAQNPGSANYVMNSLTAAKAVGNVIKAAPLLVDEASLGVGLRGVSSGIGAAGLVANFYGLTIGIRDHNGGQITSSAAGIGLWGVMSIGTSEGVGVIAAANPYVAVGSLVIAGGLIGYSTYEDMQANKQTAQTILQIGTYLQRNQAALNQLQQGNSGSVGNGGGG